MRLGITVAAFACLTLGACDMNSFNQNQKERQRQIAASQEVWTSYYHDVVAKTCFVDVIHATPRVANRDTFIVPCTPEVMKIAAPLAGHG